MKILSLFLLAGHGVPIVACHQMQGALYDYLYSYQEAHEAFLKDAVTQQHIRSLSLNSTLHLQKNHKHFYLKRIPVGSSEKVFVFVTDSELERPISLEVLFTKIKTITDGVDAYAGDAAKEQVSRAFQKLIETVSTEDDLYPRLEQKKYTPSALFQQKKMIIANELPCDYRGQDGIYSYDYTTTK